MARDKLKLAYNSCKADAARRGIGFKLTYKQWLRVWERSGHLHERGRGLGKYQMGRFGDVGPYAIGNVFILSHSQNASDANKGTRRWSKLTSKDVRSIRNSKLTERELADVHGVACSTIHYAKTGENWADIDAA